MTRRRPVQGFRLGPPNERKFDGHVYTLWAWHSKKLDAQREAKQHRERGLNVRIVKYTAPQRGAWWGLAWAIYVDEKR